MSALNTSYNIVQANFHQRVNDGIVTIWLTAASLLERIILNVSARAPHRTAPFHRVTQSKRGQGVCVCVREGWREGGRGLSKGFSRAARAHWYDIPITECARVRGSRVHAFISGRPLPLRICNRHWKGAERKIFALYLRPICAALIRSFNSSVLKAFCLKMNEPENRGECRL